MAVLKREIRQQARLTIEKTVTTGTRVFIVRNVTGVGFPAAADDAVAAAGIPSVDDQWSASRSSLKCVSVEPTLLGGRLARILCRYSDEGTGTFAGSEAPTDNNEPATAETDFFLKAIRTTKDRNGADITVSRPPQEYGDATQVKEIEKTIVAGRLVFKRKELDKPTQRMRDFPNHVNSASVGGGNYPARTLKCVGIKAQTDNDGAWYRVTYLFDYRSDTWDGEEVTWTRANGEQPNQHDAGSRKTVEREPEANFSLLTGLDFTD